MIQLNERLEGRDCQPRHLETSGAVRLESKSAVYLRPALSSYLGKIVTPVKIFQRKLLEQ